ncbi:MAG: beta-galactosidase [Clostridia bacterium]|nr:beta-galactosidase [Clostridia bacterium]
MMQLKKVLAGVLTIAISCSLMPVWASINGTEKDIVSISGWEVWSQKSDSAVYIEDMSKQGRGNVLKLDNKTVKVVDNCYSAATTKISVEAGKTYKMEFDAKAQDAKGVRFTFDWGQRFSMTPVASTYDWNTFKFSYTPTETKTLIPQWWVDDKTEGFWLDNVRMYDVENPDVNLVVNGSFEIFDGVIEAFANTTAATTGGNNGNFDVFYKEGITVDGKKDDWDGVEVHEITQRDELGGVITNIITANIRYAYDNEKLYFFMEVNDPTHVANATSRFWEGDSMQFNYVSPAALGTGTKGGISIATDDGKVYKTADTYEGTAVRDGDMTYYEVAVPWTAGYDGIVPEKFGFDAIVNNNDGNGRVYALEITEGMVRTTTVGYYKDLLIWKPVGDVVAYMDYPLSVAAGEGEGTLHFKNLSDGTKSVQISSQSEGINQSVAVPSNGSTSITFPLNTMQAGAKTISVTLGCDGKSNTIEHPMNVYYGHTQYLQLVDKLDGYIKELKDLIYRCEYKGMEVDYEMAAYSYLCKFREIIPKEAAFNDYSRMHIYDEQYAEIFEKAKTDLLAYLDGSKKPLEVPKYVTSPVRKEGKAFYAMTENNGVLEERPIFLLGYGHIETPADLVDFWPTVGSNIFTTDLTRMKDTFSAYPANPAKYWHLAGGNNAVGTFEHTDETSASGKYSMKAVNEKNTGSEYRYMQQTITAKPNTTYVLGLKAKGSKITDGFFCAQDLDMVGRVKIVDSSDWVEYSVEHTTGPWDDSLLINIVIPGTIEAMYIDDVYCVEKGTTENLFRNGDFETLKDPKPDYEKEAEEMGWYIERASEDRIRDVLQKAEESNILVDLGMATNYIDNWMYEWYPDLKETYTNFMPYAMDHPMIRKMIDIQAAHIAQILNDYDCIATFMLINEAQSYLYDGTRYIPKWQEYLKKTHGTIENLNAAYGSNYSSFEEVTMPPSMLPEGRTYDYYHFTSQEMTEWHQYMADALRKHLDPNTMLHTKIMTYIYDHGGYNLMNGADHEYLASVTDLNANDTRTTRKNSITILDKMAWYDFQASVMDAPVLDGEEHIYEDVREADHAPIARHHVATEMWDGLFHNRSASMIWMFDLNEFGTPWLHIPNYLNANFAFRPADSVMVSEVMLDAQRLAKEIVAFQEKEPEIGLLYSRTSVIYESEATRLITAAYDEAHFSGQKVGFVGDSMADQIDKYNLFIVTGSTNVSKDMLHAIKAYIEKGGKVLLMGENQLARDEYNRPHDQAILDYIYANSDRTSTVKEKIDAMNLSEVVLVDAETGNKLDKVEWSYVEYEGKILVHIVNHHNENYNDTKDFNAKIMYNGKQVMNYDELRSGESMTGNILLKTYQPVLISFDK